MKICQVNPGCGIPIPPPNWGAIEKIVWEFHLNFRDLNHKSDIKFANQIHTGEYDIVHCHVANLALQLAAKGIPYVYQLHDHHAYHYGKDSSTYKENLEAIDKSLITLLPARFLVDYFDHPKAIYFSHGVNTDIFYPIEKLPPQNPKLLMVAANGLGGTHGGFDRKGFTFGLALAMKRNLDITIAGPGFNKSWFNNNLWMFNYSKLNLVFDTPNSELLDLYHKHDIFLHPSMLEAGHPNLTLLEAMSSGLPTIANWELGTDLHGAWRAPRDVFEMERGLNDMINNFDAYRNKCLATSQELSWLNRSKDLIEIYKNLKF